MKISDSWLMENISSFSDRRAITDSTGEFSYSELHSQINEYINKLTNEGVKSGNVVVISSDYNFHAIALFLALYECKAIIVPIVSNIKDEIDKKIEVSASDFLISIENGNEINIHRLKNDDKHELVDELIDRKESGLILFSSGSTGEPKAMIHNLNSLVDVFKGRKKRSLNIIIFLMFDHIGGLNTLLNFIASGAKIILPKNRNPEHIAELIEDHMVHILPASPTFLNMLLIAGVTEKYNLESLKMITYGTETMPESLLHRLRSAFPKTKFLQTFGTSETGIAQTKSRSSESLEMKLDDENQEYKIVNGELWLRSKTQILGYLNSDMDSFTEDGWFKTGDLVEELDDGYIRIIGREKEIINVGGEKVLPSEVESYLLQISFILDALVKGEKNAITGQSVVANVVIKDGYDQKVAKRDIRAYCKKNMPMFKVPTKINFLDQLDVSDRSKKIRLDNDKAQD